MTGSVDPVKMAHYEPSRQDLHCLSLHLFCSTGLKGLRGRFSTRESIFATSCLLIRTLNPSVKEQEKHCSHWVYEICHYDA